MVDFSTSATIVDASSVALPVLGVNCNSQRTSIETILYVLASIKLNMSIGWFELTCLFLAVAFNSLIRIFCTSNKSFISNIGQSAISTSTLASKSSVRSRAVDDLLFR